jgi:hypothetical protein
MYSESLCYLIWNIFVDIFCYTEDIDGATCNILETILSNNVIDRETPVGSEDMLSSPTCTQSSLQNDQSKSIVTFAASVEACIGTKHENAKLNNSPVHDTKSTYSSSVSFSPYKFVLFILLGLF